MFARKQPIDLDLASGIAQELWLTGVPIEMFYAQTQLASIAAHEVNLFERPAGCRRAWRAPHDPTEAAEGMLCGHRTSSSSFVRTTLESRCCSASARAARRWRG
jgi:hypothetical protein